MINANELRLGNTIEYHIVDTVDGTDEWIDNAVDIGDLQCLLEDPNDPFYRPKVLTEECLMEFGFGVRETPRIKEWYIGKNPVTHDWLFSLIWLKYPEDIDAPNAPFYLNGFHTIYFVHQLQNLYMDLKGEELKKKEVES